MSTITLVEHLARVEGHGGITVEMDGDAITEVRFDVLEGPRLLEALVVGQPYDQVAPILSRVCAICSAAHALTSLKATEAAFGIVPSPRTELLRELLFRGENIESHSLHVFLLALPDHLDAPSAIALAAERPDVVRLGLRLKQLGNTIQEVVGGRAIHPVTPVVGGMSHVPSASVLERLRDELRWAVSAVGDAVALMAALPTGGFVESDTTYAALEMRNEYGYYAPGGPITVLSPAGRRYIAPEKYRTLTNERAVGRTYTKLSAFEEAPVMVGALARLTVNRRRLTAAGAAAVGALGLVLPSGDPMDNTRAQVVELVMDVERSLALVERLLDGDLRPEPPPRVTPRAGTGTAVTEAPRGLLVHDYEYDAGGRVVHADVVTPTAINAMSLERHMRETAEQAPRGDLELLRGRLELVARAYDPCISCAVHLVVRGDAGRASG